MTLHLVPLVHYCIGDLGDTGEATQHASPRVKGNG